MATFPAITTPLQAPTCPLCGQPNQCAASATGSFEVDCWCRGVAFPATLLATVPAERQGKACICRDCAERHLAGPGGDGQGAASSSPGH